MLELILGRAGSGKTSLVMQRLRRRCEDGRAGGILLVPEQYSHEAERELCAVCGDSLSLYAEVLSFTQLASRVEEELGFAGRLLDRGGRLLCMALAAKQAAPKLSVYRDAARRPELQRSLLDALDELKSAGIRPDALERAAGSAGPSLGAKLRDMSLICEAYRAVCETSAADSSDRLDRLAEHIGGSAVCRGHIFIDGFTDLTRQELDVVRALLSADTELTVCLTLDPGDDGEIFELPRRTADILRRMAKDAGVPVTETVLKADASGRSPVLRRLERELFSPSPTPAERCADGVSLFITPDIRGECELAAARTIELVRDGNCRWRDVSVAVRGFGDYQAALEAAFARYGVPLFTGSREDIMKRAVPAYISSALEIVTGGWEYEDVFSLLRTGLYGLSAEETDELENYVILWSIRGNMWTSPAGWRLHPAGYGGEWTDAARNTLERLNSLRQRVAGPLMELQRAGAAAQTAAEQAGALADFLAAAQLPLCLKRRTDELTSQGRLREAAEYSQLWDIVCRALEQFCDILGGESMEQDEFARLFGLCLSRYDVGVIPVSLDRVLAGDMDRMRRRHTKHLIVLGASDERLPAPAGSGGVFSADEREALLELDIPLGGRDEELCREFGLIYNCLTLPSDSLCVSYPTSGADGAQTRPSFVVRRICSLLDAEIKRVEPAELRTAAAGPALELAAAGDPDALRWFEERQPGRLAALARAAASPRGSLSTDSVRSLYGQKLRLSASRVESLASCRFSYFLRYGLKAKPREPAGFNPPEYGSFIHTVLEDVASGVRDSGGFKSAPKDLIIRLCDESVARYVRDELSDFRDRSPRFVYLFRRLTETVRQVALDMADELRRSDFTPLSFELSFGSASGAPPVELEGDARVVGVADRVDGWVHDGKLYLRVVDYKTGRKAFSLSDVWYGMNMQLLMYLFTLEKTGSALYGREVAPAGVLYVPARDEMIKSTRRLDDDELLAEREKSRRRSGLLLDDPDVLAAMESGDAPVYIPVKFKNGAPGGDSLATAARLGLLGKRVEQTLAGLASQLRRGCIDADPYFRNQQENACRWCDYAEACRFDESRDKRRYLTKLPNEEFWARLENGEGART